jgi:hypothetical protein
VVGLPGHSIDKCVPLINFAIAQALAAQHPEVVRSQNQNCRQTIISSKCMLCSLTLHARPPSSRVSPFWTSLPWRTCLFLWNRMIDSDVSNFVTSLDFDDPDLFHCRVQGPALVTYRDQAWFSSTTESPVHTLDITNAPLGPCMIFSDDTVPPTSTL